MAEMSTYERAIQIYQILIGAAYNRQVLTYPILGRRIGVPDRGLAPHLKLLMRYCQREGLPPLTVLVVKKEIGKPGPGLTTVKEKHLHKERERVFAHNWYRMKPLTVAELEAIHQSRRVVRVARRGTGGKNVHHKRKNR
jgi:hypothetical protein